jgi:glycine/D-amino acid oxidase-like deaminating enzyme
MDCDILVIGAGILGLSSAYHLKMRNPGKRVVVIERLSGAGQGNSAKSAGGLRNVFTSETNFLLADSGIDFYSHLERDAGFDLKLHRNGYLWLLSESQYSSLKKLLDKMKNRGIETRLFEEEELKRMIPDLVLSFPSGDEEAIMMGLEPIHVGVFGPKCGGLDADSLVKSYESMFLGMGGEIFYNTEAERLVLEPERRLDITGEPFVWQKSLVNGARTNLGEIKADTTIVTAGIWSEKLLNPIGFDVVNKPKKRQVFVFKDLKLQNLQELKGLNESEALPLTLLPKAGIYLKSEASEGSIWLGCSDHLGREFEVEDDPQPEREFYARNIYDVLVKYFPCFKDLREVNMWAGHYAINTVDGIPIVEPAPGMIYAGATSGSGLMKGDALGRIVTSNYMGEDEAELYGGRKFKVSNIGISNRKVAREGFVI